jgi:hypothetical protein
VKSAAVDAELDFPYEPFDLLLDQETPEVSGCWLNLVGVYRRWRNRRYVARRMLANFDVYVNQSDPQYVAKLRQRLIHNDQHTCGMIAREVQTLLGVPEFTEANARTVHREVRKSYMKKMDAEHITEPMARDIWYINMLVFTKTADCVFAQQLSNTSIIKSRRRTKAPGCFC